MRSKQIIQSIFEKKPIPGSRVISPLLASGEKARTPPPETAPLREQKQKKGIGIIGQLLGQNVATGIDIRPQTIRIAQIQGTPSHWVVALADQELIRPCAPRSVQWFQELRSALQKLILRVPIQGNLIVGCALPYVMLRRIELPSLPDSELASSIYHTTGGWMPYPQTEREVYWSPVRRSGNTQQALAQVGHAPFIQEMEEVFKNTTKHNIFVAHSGLGYHALAGSYRAEPEKSFAVVELSEDSLLMAVVDHWGVWMVRDISLGVQDFLRVLRNTITIENRTVSLSEAEARNYLKSYGLLREIPRQENIPPIFTNLPAVLGPLVERIQSEIQRSLEYFREQIRGNPVERVFLSGLGSQLPGAHLIVPAGLPASFEGVALRGKGGQAISSEFAVSAGLALSTFQNIQFRKAEENMMPRKILGMNLLQATVLLAILLLASTWGGARIFSLRQARLLSQSRAALEKRAPQLLARKNILQQTKRIQAWRGWTQIGQSEAAVWKKGWDLLQSDAFKEININKWEGESREGNRILRVSGSIASTDTNPELIAYQFLENLKRTDFVLDARLLRTIAKKGVGKGELGFDALLTLSPPSAEKTQ